MHIIQDAPDTVPTEFRRAPMPFKPTEPLPFSEGGPLFAVKPTEPVDYEDNPLFDSSCEMLGIALVAACVTLLFLLAAILYWSLK